MSNNYALITGASSGIGLEIAKCLAEKKYNVIIGMYHDQVLTPIKTLFEYDAINITLGLPFLRISPDHGPNEKMMGKNKSNPLSLVSALTFLDFRK